MLALRLSRRGFVKANLAAMIAGVLERARGTDAPPPEVGIGFVGVAPSADDALKLPGNYQAAVLIAWGDPLGIAGDMPAFKLDASNTSGEQEAQAGMHHDGMWFFPLPYDSASSTRGLLAINHEYVDDGLLHPNGRGTWTAEKVRKSQAAIGVSVVEVKIQNGKWEVVRPTPYARRITTRTPCALSGPAAGSASVKTALDPTGREVLGTCANCASGWTPWGTYLSCEGSWNDYFANSGAVPPDQRRYGVGAGRMNWEKFDERFDAEQHPNEPNRFGWVVEIDPYAPASKPVKRTALGRMKHAGACPSIGPEGRIAFYMGDHEGFEYLYKFVTARPYDSKRRWANRDLLDEGTLYAAKFYDDGTGAWLALEHGANGLTEANGFANQADVLVRTRQAADRAGATPMDRPAWCAVNHMTREAFVSLTNNWARGHEGLPAPDAANPRAYNLFGHILRWREASGDPAATHFTWDVFALAGTGEGEDQATRGRFKGDAFACPDGLWMGRRGVLWVETGVPANALNEGSYAPLGNNQLLAVEPVAGVFERFLVGPRGSEVTGLLMTPDGRNAFINIQHPGEAPGGESDPDQPRLHSNWPDFDPKGRPRSATVVIRKRDGGVIGA